MQLLVCILAVSCALAQRHHRAVDRELLAEIFGPPPTEPLTTSAPSTTLKPLRFEPTQVNSTSERILVDENGQRCQCVPYYLCTANYTLSKDRLKKFTGFGELDIRSKRDRCIESTETCCTDPQAESEEIRQPSDASLLKGCGYRNKKGLDFTVTGGTGQEALFGEFPWVVALLNNSNDAYVGVGVLIHPQVVLTVAHIAIRFSSGTLKIRAGEWDTQTVKERLRHQERVVQDISIHLLYHESNVRNDVALLRLKEPVVLADHINVICLPQQNESFDTSKNCVANGWGKEKFNQPDEPVVILKRVEVDMVPHQECNDQLKKTRLGTYFVLHESFVCAGGEEGKDTCKGDGGAPLVCPIGDDRYKLSGLVAWGIGCGEKTPGVYASVALFRTWIDQKMADWRYETSGYSV